MYISFFRSKLSLLGQNRKYCRQDPIFLPNIHEFFPFYYLLKTKMKLFFYLVLHKSSLSYISVTRWGHTKDGYRLRCAVLPHSLVTDSSALPVSTLVFIQIPLPGSWGVCSCTTAEFIVLHQLHEIAKLLSIIWYSSKDLAITCSWNVSFGTGFNSWKTY